MKTPPLLIGAAIIFWSIETGNLLIGLFLFLLIEGSYVVKNRYHMKEDDFVKISDLTSLIFLGSVSLILLNYEPIGFLRITTGWLPLILSPLMLAQTYSTSDKIVIGTRFGKKKKTYSHKPMDFRFYYIMICLFAAATSNSRSIWFFPALALIITWFLYWNRGRSYSPLAFVSFLVVSLGLGYVCVFGMEHGQRYVLQKTYGYMRSYYTQKYADPFKNHVNFGDTGKMKLSGAIIMRVDSSSSPPDLFRETSYSTYQDGDWIGSQRDFEFLPPLTETTWDLIQPPHKKGDLLKVEFNLPKEKGLVPLPHGGYHLISETIGDLSQSGDNTVKALESASLLLYDLFYHAEMQGKRDLPRPVHLAVPGGEMYALDQVIELLQLPEGRPDAGKVSAITQYFNNEFSYSLSLVGKGNYDTALGNFLLERKRGFCEYYATATALLLRRMGIHSRYVIGYAVTEKSALEGKYVVRKRHAHAWAEAFIDGGWVVVDTTPADWAEIDAQRATFWEDIGDIFSLIRHKYKIFQVGSGKDYTLIFSVIVVLLTAFLVIRIYRRLKIEQARKTEESVQFRTFDPIHSPFTEIVEMVEQSDTMQSEGESFVQWAKRSVDWQNFESAEFDRLYRLHLQLRFDPEGLDDKMWKNLEKGAQKYLDMRVI